MGLIVSLDELRATDAATMGTKAAALGELMAAGFRVPPGFIVTTDAQRNARGDTVPPQLLSAVSDAYARLGQRLDEREPRVAVRSSVIEEDGTVASFAGVFCSVTNVRGATGIAAAIERCWMSLNGERARGYRATRRVAPDAAMTVVVQAMVTASRGGVAFSVDPTGRNVGMVVVEASFGHAAAVATGLVEPDFYLVARDSGHMVAVHLGSKAFEIVPCREGEITVSVPPARRRLRALARDEAASVARLALAAEKCLNAPQDVEWCFDADGLLFLLQARPIPAIEHRRSMIGRRGAAMAIGVGAAPGVATGRVRVLCVPEESVRLEPGEILVVGTSSPEWGGVLDRAAAVVTDRGGVTCHLAIASREAGIPCVVAARTATVDLRTGDLAEVDGNEGLVRSAPD
jgi:pyruvate, water dikinase